MFKSLAVISLLSTAVFAQSSNSSSLIPSGISSSCEAFLTDLDNNGTISTCVSPMLQATNAYAPGSSSSTPSASSMATICGASTCPAATLRALLSNFSSQCSDELTTSPNPNVVMLYDVLYLNNPMYTALCSKSDSGSYCALASTTTTSSSAAAASVVAAAEDAQKYISDNGALNRTAFTNDSVPFMFLSSSGLTSAQCTTCTRNIMTSYINWESDSPYAPGLANSQLLSGQTALYTAMTTTCGSGFLSGAVQAAGGLGTGSKDNGSLKSTGFDIRTVAVALVSMLMASML